MIKKVLVATAALMLGVIVTSSSVSAAEITVNSGESIQTAVNAANPGDIITVAAGTYAGPVNITKQLTLRGAQVGVDARDRSGAETVIATQYNGGFNIQSAGVVIDGFTIDGTDATVYGRGIVLAAGLDLSDLMVMNNVILNNQTGIVTAGAGTTVDNLTVRQNVFLDNSNPSAAAGVYVANAVGTNLQITDNIFSGTDDRSPGSSNAISLSGTPSVPLDTIVIEGNVSEDDGAFVYVYHARNVIIDTNTSDNQAGSGVLVGSNVDQISITNNTLTNSSNGVTFNGSIPASNVELSGNTITGMTTAGIFVNDGAITGDVTVAEHTIVGNAAGITNQSTIAVDANNNWWGCEAGPGATGCDSISGVVLASSWYTDASLTATNLDADDAAAVPGVPNTSWGINYVGLIMAAIAGAAVVGVAATTIYRRQTTNS